MAAIQRSIVIRAPPARVYAQLADPVNLLEVWPSLIAVRDTRVDADGRHAFDWTYKMAGLSFRGHCQTVEVEPDRLRADHNTGAIPSTFRWSFQPQGEHTDVKLEIAYEAPGLVRAIAGSALRAMNEREAETLLANLKTRIETGVAPVARSG